VTESTVSLGEVFNGQFLRIHRNSLSLIEAVPADRLYWKPRETQGVIPVHSCGEQVLRSAGIVERTFGGLTTNLWDDPFEWTLPEILSTSDLVNSYLNEVEATRLRGFQLFRSDGDFMKEIVGPSGERQTISSLLMDTLVSSAHHQGRAFATFRFFSNGFR
jgi:hypothetical protein